MNFQKIMRRSLKVFLILLLICSAGLGYLYYWVQHHPEELANKYLGELAQKTGLSITFKALHVTLWPLPTLGIGDLNIQGKDFELNIAWLSLRPSLENLVHGDLLPGHITVLRPKLYMQAESLFNDPLKFFKKGEDKENLTKGKEEKFDLNSILPYRCVVNLVQGYFRITGGLNQLSVLNGLNAKFELEESGSLNGSANLSYLRAKAGGEARYGLEGAKISGKCNVINFNDEASELKAQGRIKILPFLEQADFTADFDYTDSDWSANVDLKALLNLDNVLVPASYSGRLFSLSDSLEIISRKSDFALDADSGRLEFSLHLPMRSHPWRLGGKVFLNRASLTQWLGFARGLPPGLQMALDNVTNASLDFKLDEKSLQVENIEASCTGATFRGSGGVPDFAAPVVMLDLKSEKVNLGLAIPESLVKDTEPVYFPYEPLTPRSGIPLKEGETGIGYDIKLAAKTVIYGPVLIQNAKLRIYPGKMDRIRLEDVLLDATGDFYGGSLKGHCILGADPSLPIYISSSAKNINMASLSQAMPEIPLKKGSFQAEGSVFSRGKKLKEFMDNLDGPISLSGVKVSMPEFTKEQISRISLKEQLKGAKIIKNGVSFGGKWNLEAQLNKVLLALDLDGFLAFGKDGLSIKSVPSRIKMTFLEKNGPLSANTSLQLQGQLNAQSAKNQYSMDKVAMELPGTKITGNLVLNAKALSASGVLHAQVEDSGKLLKFFSYSGASLPKLFSKFSLQSNYNASAQNIKLDNMKLKAGECGATGALSLSLQATPFLEFNLHVGSLDWQKHFASSSAKKSSSWDFSYLKNFDCAGKLQLVSFSGWGLKFTQIELPLKLQKGKLSIPAMHANFFGSNLKMQVEADFDKKLSFKSIIDASEFKLEDLVKAQKIESEIRGLASLNTVLSASLDGPGELLTKINGIWNLKIISAIWQSRDKNGQLKGSPTRFDLVRSSGKIQNGRMESNDILLKSSDMQVTGEGWLNLVSNKIDCKLNVDMKNMPEFPLYVYGPLAKPTTSIGAGKLVLNAIGGITTGIGNIFGSMFKAVGNAFR